MNKTTEGLLAGKPAKFVPLPGHTVAANRLLRLNLTRKENQNSPSTDAHQPVSHQHKQEYHRY